MGRRAAMVSCSTHWMHLSSSSHASFTSFLPLLQPAIPRVLVAVLMRSGVLIRKARPVLSITWTVDSRFVPCLHLREVLLISCLARDKVTHRTYADCRPTQDLPEEQAESAWAFKRSGVDLFGFDLAIDGSLTCPARGRHEDLAIIHRLRDLKRAAEGGSSSRSQHSCEEDEEAREAHCAVRTMNVMDAGELRAKR